jgi:hypothetical protein
MVDMLLALAEVGETLEKWRNQIEKRYFIEHLRPQCVAIDNQKDVGRKSKWRGRDRKGRFVFQSLATKHQTVGSVWK